MGGKTNDFFAKAKQFGSDMMAKGKKLGSEMMTNGKKLHSQMMASEMMANSKKFGSHMMANGKKMFGLDKDMKLQNMMETMDGLEAGMRKLAAKAGVPSESLKMPDEVSEDSEEEGN